MGSVEPTGPVWSLPPLKPMVVALPCATAAVKLTGDPVRAGTVAVAPCAPTAVPKTRVAVAVNVTEEPARPVTVAVAPCAPAIVPRTRVAVARPVAPVTDEGLIEPPPVTPQVTVTPPIGLLLASVTLTLYGVGRVAPIVSV